MKAISAALLASACVFPGVALAQSASTGQSSGTGLTMPYQSTFWGHAGLSLGKSELGARCPAGQRCDQSDTVWRLYGGGRFNNIFGGEVGYVNFGDFTRGGGETDERAEHRCGEGLRRRADCEQRPLVDPKSSGEIAVADERATYAERRLARINIIRPACRCQDVCWWRMPGSEKMSAE